MGAVWEALSVSPEDPEETEYLYYEQDGMMTTMVNWLHGQMSNEEIEQRIQSE